MIWFLTTVANPSVIFHGGTSTAAGDRWPWQRVGLMERTLRAEGNLIDHRPTADVKLPVWAADHQYPGTWWFFLCYGHAGRGQRVVWHSGQKISSWKWRSLWFIALLVDFLFVDKNSAKCGYLLARIVLYLAKCVTLFQRKQQDSLPDNLVRVGGHNSVEFRFPSTRWKKRKRLAAPCSHAQYEPTFWEREKRVPLSSHLSAGTIWQVRRGQWAQGIRSWENRNW